MKTSFIFRTASAMGIVSVLLTTGCGKTSTEEVETAAPAPEAAAEAQPNQPTGAGAPAPTAAAPNVYLQQSQAALGAGDYEKATAALISAQQQANLSAQQAEAVAAQMRQLQSSLASGVASGDPKAKAAADKLRQSATVR